jgi:sterol desaturase/sphingolipid hydroxylase (fatty acid hydroxylase superfamily)
MFLTSPQTLPEFLELLAALLSLAIVLFLPFEVWRDYRRGTLNRKHVGEMLTNAFPLLPVLALYSVYTWFSLWLFGAVQTKALFHIETTPLSALLALVLVDLMYYWEHRLEHRVRALWALTHSVHHSSPIFNQTTALRISAFDGFVTPWFYLPVVLLGFEPLLVIACAGVMLGYQQWIHTETIQGLGWFDRWWNSPSNHRVHHGSQSMYLDKNFGGISMLWDRLFGTYHAESAPPVYGLKEPLHSTNVWRVHFEELTRLARAFAQTQGFRMKMRLLFSF